MEDIRGEVTRIYEQYNPSKLKDIDLILRTYRGRELALIHALREKYEGQPANPNSPKRFPPSPPTASHSSPPRPPLPHAVQQRTPPRSASASSHKETPLHATVESGVHYGGNEVLLEEMRALSQQMHAVDLTELTHRITSTSGAEGLPRQRDLFVHTLTFMKFFTKCATEYLTLASVLDRRLKEGERLAVSASAAAEANRPLFTSTIGGSPDAPSPLPPPPPPPPPQKTFRESPLRRAGTDLPNRERSTTEKGPSLGPLKPFRAPQDATMEVPKTQPANCPRVHQIAPSADGQEPVLTKIVRQGGTIALEPGVYEETLKLENCGTVELVGAYPGTPVLLRPHSDLEPVLSIKGAGSRVTVRDVVFVRGDLDAFEHGVDHYEEDPSVPAVPLVAVSGGAQVVFEGCHFYKGGAAGVTVAGKGTQARMYLCLLSLCAFSGVYARDRAVVDLVQCRVKYCECGIRVATEAALVASECAVEGHEADGVVVHEDSTASIQRSTVANNRGSGIFVSEGGDVEVSESTIELNAMYGIQRFRASRVRLYHSFVRDNGLLPISDEAEEML